MRNRCLVSALLPWIAVAASSAAASMAPAISVAPAPATSEPRAAAPARDTVVLLPGLGRSPRSMRRLGRDLETRGYRVVAVAYPTRRETVEELSRRVGAVVAEHCPDDGGRVHFVTHSLGGIVVRHYLAHGRPANLGRVVMLSPPNGGSELVDLLKQVPFVRDHLGPSRGQMGTDPESPPSLLGGVDYEVGVIAGGRSVNPLFSWLLPGDDDGVVAVERMKVDGMRDMVVVPRGHTFIMNGRDTIEQTLTFLRDGVFARPAGRPAA